MQVIVAVSRPIVSAGWCRYREFEIHYEIESNVSETIMRINPP
jgi:hypothetical protein